MRDWKRSEQSSTRRGTTECPLRNEDHTERTKKFVARREQKRGNSMGKIAQQTKGGSDEGDYQNIGRHLEISGTASKGGTRLVGKREVEN